MIDYPSLIPYADRYQQLRHEPLRVIATLRPGAHIVNYDPICLDGILAWAVVQEATEGAGVPHTNDPYCLPVPLATLWRSDDGYPLHASTSLYPVGVVHADDIHYYHKRAPTGEYSRATSKHGLSIPIRSGRWMERRIPVPTQTTMALEALCIGNQSEIQRLLAYVSHIGKRRASGMGEVAAWDVAPVDQFVLWREIDGERRLARSIPQAAGPALDIRTIDAPALVGWTPPQWHPVLQRVGWREGTVLHVN